MKHRLLAGEYPPGARLGEERLAAQLGVSRTPVREALSRLHSEGLVERLADGGFGPTLINLHLVRELYEIRFALERCALRRTDRHGEPVHDEEQLRHLRADWADLDAPAHDDEVLTDFVLLDEDFHERLAGASGNQSLTDQLHKVNERIRIVRMQDFLSAGRVELTIEQHVGVLDALLYGDVDLAEARLVGHFAESLDVVEERAAHTIARMLDRRDR
ncbi:MAG: GntR family transcriptional regulator [Acidimicrobiales bacterium]